mgnify:CR=1 FL=1
MSVGVIGAPLPGRRHVCGPFFAVDGAAKRRRTGQRGAILRLWVLCGRHVSAAGCKDFRIRRDHGVCLVASHMRCPDGRPRGEAEAPTGVSMVVFYVPELAAIAETALLDRQRIFELVRS